MVKKTSLVDFHLILFSLWCFISIYYQQFLVPQIVITFGLSWFCIGRKSILFLIIISHSFLCQVRFFSFICHCISRALVFDETIHVALCLEKGVKLCGMLEQTS